MADRILLFQAVLAAFMGVYAATQKDFPSLFVIGLCCAVACAVRR